MELSDRELASTRSFWKRRQLRDGRRSRLVKVREMRLETVRADAIEGGLADEIVTILGTGKEADVYLALWKEAPLALKVYRLHRTARERIPRLDTLRIEWEHWPGKSSRLSRRPTGPEYLSQLRLDV